MIPRKRPRDKPDIPAPRVVRGDQPPSITAPYHKADEVTESHLPSHSLTQSNRCLHSETLDGRTVIQLPNDPNIRLITEQLCEPLPLELRRALVRRLAEIVCKRRCSDA